MSEPVIGHCVHTYLKHQAVMAPLESQESLPADLKDDEATLRTFWERASEQAVGILESLYGGVVSAGALTGFRTERRSQRRTVRDYWYMEGRLFRPRERHARTLWYLCLGCLRDRGPVATLILKPYEPVSTTAIDRFAAAFAPELGLESANARECFTHDRGFDCGVIAAAVKLEPAAKQVDVSAAMKKQLDGFVKNQREKFEQALETSAD